MSVNLTFNHGPRPEESVPALFQWSPSDCEHCCEYLLEAWERQTTGGLIIEWLPTRARNDNPWGFYRFSGIHPVNLRSWDDRGNGKWY